MTNLQIKQALMLYRDIIKEALDADASRTPQKLADPDFDKLKHNIPWVMTARHVAWMCDKAWELVQGGETEKAMRWLGFIQGYLWCENIRSINKMRDDNR